MPVLRVGSYNILHGMRVLGGAQEQDVDALRDSVALLDVDVLGMQEVDAAQPRSGLADQTALAAAALGAQHWRFVPTVVGTPGPGANFRPSTDTDVDAAWRGEFPAPKYGVGLVSRIPVREWHYLLMPAANVTMPLLVPGSPRPRLLRVPDEPRAAVAAVLDLPTPVTVCTVHLSFVPLTNTRQLRDVKRWLAPLPRPTYPVFRPRVQFDHVLSDGIAGHGGKTHALPVSDHCAVTAEFSL